MARPHIEPYVVRHVDFKRMTLPGFKKGMHYKMLSFDTDTGACSMTVKFEAGYKLPPGMSYSELEMFVLKGTIRYGDHTYGKGHYFWVPAGVTMPAFEVPRGCEVLMFYNYGEPSFVDSDEDHPQAARDKLTIVDSYEGMSWMSADLYPAVASGCLVKILRYDELTRAFTFLYNMSPMFRQDNISYHDCSEESYHIFGSSRMMQFGDLPTDGYFWRPPWINHGAFECERGCLALGRTDSELHNYFHFNPWTTPKENKERAAAKLFRYKPELYQWVRAQDDHNHPHDFEHPHYHEHDGVGHVHDHDHSHKHD
ncbi:MAG: DUF4437 domain-containing protein [Pseudomonadota bacterium]